MIGLNCILFCFNNCSQITKPILIPHVIVTLQFFLSYVLLQGRILWYLLFSVDYSGILKPIDFAGEVFLPFSEGFVGSNEAVKPSYRYKKHIRTRIFAKYAKSSSSQSRRFGRPSRPTVFGRQYQKNRILKPTTNKRQPTKNRRYQKNTS